jgi:hypothetical protein
MCLPTLSLRASRVEIQVSPTTHSALHFRSSVIGPTRSTAGTICEAGARIPPRFCCWLPPAAVLAATTKFFYQVITSLLE